MTRLGFAFLLTPIAPILFLLSIRFGFAMGAAEIGANDLYAALGLGVVAFIVSYLIALTDPTMKPASNTEAPAAPQPPKNETPIT